MTLLSSLSCQLPSENFTMNDAFSRRKREGPVLYVRSARRYMNSTTAVAARLVTVIRQHRIKNDSIAFFRAPGSRRLSLMWLTILLCSAVRNITTTNRITNTPSRQRIALTIYIPCFHDALSSTKPSYCRVLYSSKQSFVRIPLRKGPMPLREE